METLESVVDKYRAAEIPLDTIWSDIDYMEAYRVFTLDPINFPRDKMQPFLKKVHDAGQHYVMIVDPGESQSSSLDWLELNHQIRVSASVNARASLADEIGPRPFSR